MKYMQNLILLFSFLFIVSCTVSLQNTSTNGKATDLIDQEMSPTNDISPTLEVPLIK